MLQANKRVPSSVLSYLKTQTSTILLLPIITLPSLPEADESIAKDNTTASSHF